MCAKSLQSCPALCDPMDCSLPESSVHGNSPGKNTGVVWHALLQRICPTQGSNLSLLSFPLSGGFFTTSTTWEGQWWRHVIINLSKPTECKTLRMNPSVNYGLCVIKKKKKSLYTLVFLVTIMPFITGWGTDLDYCNTEWFVLETNRDHSVIFEIASKYWISDFCWLWWLLHFF